MPRNQDEFDSLVFGRDDLIPGLGFGCLPIVSGCKLGAGTNGFAYSFRLNSDTGRPAFNLGKYTYENTGPSSGLIRFVDAHGNIFKFALEFERWGNIRVTITDDEGEATTWPGMDHLDLTLGAQPILLPIPPSWSAAIAIETDNYAFETHSWDISFKLQSQLFPDWDDLIFSEGGLDFSKSFSRVGRNRFVYTLKFRMRDPSLVYGRNEEESNRRRKLNGSEWSFVVTITSDGGAEFSLTVSKEGNPTITEEGFVDFTEDGDDSDPDEFPEELKLPDEQPQASGQDLPDLEVAAAITALDIGNDDLQPLLVSAEGGGFQPGDWLEPKDGGNQRMMVVSAGLPTSLSALVAEYIPPDPMALSAAAPALEYLPSGGLALAPPGAGVLHASWEPCSGLQDSGRSRAIYDFRNRNIQGSSIEPFRICHGRRGIRAVERRVYAVRSGHTDARSQVLFSGQDCGRPRSTVPETMRIEREHEHSGLCVGLRRGVEIDDDGTMNIPRTTAQSERLLVMPKTRKPYEEEFNRRTIELY